LATAWAGALAKASGIDQVITIDVHSERARQLFPVPVVTHSPAELFAGALNQFGLNEATFVAPDEGARCRCQAVKTAAGLGEGDIAYFEKHRSATGITQIGPIGQVGRRRC